MKKLMTTLTATAAIATFTLADQEAEASSTHTVKPGDTLWAIANSNNMSVSELKNINNLTSDIIYPNQSLQLSGSVNTREEDTSSASTYTVKAGDTLSKIANVYGMNYRTLMDINGINSYIIYPGQVLKLSGNVEATRTVERNTNNTTSNGNVSGTTQQTNVDTTSNRSVNETTNTASYSAPAPVYSSYNGVNYYNWGSCAWYVFERRSQMGKGVGNDWGNAHNWAWNARSAGYSVNNTPSVGAIMQAHAWTNNAWGLGHVAIVERINYDGSILVSEMQFGGGAGVKTFRTLSAAQASNHNFIH